MIHHRIYGLLLESNEALPGLPSLTDGGIPDVRVHIKPSRSPLGACDASTEFFHISCLTDEGGQSVLRVGYLENGKYVVLLYSDGTRFALDGQGNEVFVDWPDSLTLEDAAPYLVGPVLGVLLRLRGMVPLHASSVAIGEHAIAFAGPAGAGKSTAAAAFAQRGHRVVSDDVVVALLEKGEHFSVPPGYPRVNLWDDSVRGVLGEGSALPLISPGWDKRFLALDPSREFESRSLPLAAVYVLQKRDSGQCTPSVDSLAGAEAFVAILGNTYMNYLPDMEKRRREFELLTRLVARVPIRRVQPAVNISSLPDLCAAIEADVQRLCVSAEAIGPSKGVK
jgi:hypothetical protein